MEEPVKFRNAISTRTIVSSMTLAEVIKFLPPNTDMSKVEVKARDYSVLVTYPVVEKNPNYEAEMENFLRWKNKRISELEAELNRLRPSPGRLPDISE